MSTCIHWHKLRGQRNSITHVYFYLYWLKTFWMWGSVCLHVLGCKWVADVKTLAKCRRRFLLWCGLHNQWSNEQVFMSEPEWMCVCVFLLMRPCAFLLIRVLSRFSNYSFSVSCFYFLCLFFRPNLPLALLSSAPHPKIPLSFCLCITFPSHHLSFVFRCGVKNSCQFTNTHWLCVCFFWWLYCSSGFTWPSCLNNVPDVASMMYLIFFIQIIKQTQSGIRT